MNECLLCGGAQLLKLLDLGEHPVAHNYLDNPSHEEYVHPVTLCFCESCGLVQLVNPIAPELLYTNYVCLSSWKHQPHIPRLVQMVEEITGLNKSDSILEVGSNDGRFLEVLRRRGYQKLVGIEPACDAQDAAKKKDVKTIPSYFNLKTAKKFVANCGKCDLFVSRQMLEHISNLKEFQEGMRTVLSPGGFVVFEVPNFSCNLDTLDYTIWEEHVNYFTPATLSLFLSKAGIRVIHSETTLFSGDALTVVGRYEEDSPNEPSLDYMKILRPKVLNYRDKWPAFRNSFVQYLHEHKEKGGKVAVYGAGARVCSLINFTGLVPYIEFIVDDQLEKQGKYMPGSRLPILPSDELEKHSIDLCLLAVNTECEDRVINKHAAFRKKDGTFVSVLPPSNRLPSFWNSMLDSRIAQDYIILRS